ncbi:hypothetical protein BUALT_Bualt18G0056800 [Buddleja alternifolia]|uniref:Four helix bundle protein n=1 Tax=Buddleja alternifolia TaxID=168488 RepID=A0AAV6W3P4_9LAMI|nr:hypothetical protein BUALT_Bualt18G0056800 [Buddleja alternifolia]
MEKKEARVLKKKRYGSCRKDTAFEFLLAPLISPLLIALYPPIPNRSPTDLFPEEANATYTKKAVVEILDGACKMVIEKFKNCAYEEEFYEKAYEMHRALIKIIELYMDNHRDTQSWLTRLRKERDNAYRNRNMC